MDDRETSPNTMNDAIEDFLVITSCSKEFI